MKLCNLEERLDELGRKYHETHDPKVKRQIESLSKRLAMTPKAEEEDEKCE